MAATKKNKRKAIDWEAIEREYRAFEHKSIRRIALEHGITHQAIMGRAKKCGWKRNLARPTTERAREKLLTGQVTGAATKKDEEIVEEAADATVAVVKRCQQFWEPVNDLRVRALDEEDFELMKLVKITTEATRNIQDGIFKSYGINGNLGGLLGDDTPDAVQLVTYRRDT